mmetsp:Transcript_4941/g.14112  ORF Transcript_4941/g.14112 Transcript_4941/m.14112 type:complete len:84 (-) Transcript_4941:2184-2435(-)
METLGVPLLSILLLGRFALEEGDDHLSGYVRAVEQQPSARAVPPLFSFAEISIRPVVHTVLSPVEDGQEELAMCRQTLEDAFS